MIFLVAVNPTHSKVYCFETNQGNTAFVGSSNLTENGLKRNIEFTIPVSEPVKYEECEGFFDTIWADSMSIQDMV
ncbi:hypothetical protein D1872_171100 [compost metagenome]